MSKLARGSFLIGAVAVAGCSNEPNGVCVGVGRPAVDLRVVDAVTRESLLWESTVLFTMRRATDTVIVGPPLYMTAPPNIWVGLGEITGVYLLEVRRAGYEIWRKSGVVRDACGEIITQDITAELTRNND